jgi:hypothetical protein
MAGFEFGALSVGDFGGEFVNFKLGALLVL